ncbi:hypothetical protein [Caulobacter flavus]|nr:hypothetical protein [Caulobacter flavus]
MRRLFLLTMLCAAGCASGGSTPSARDVARIETAITTIEDIQAVGVGDSAAMARAARTRVRALRCGPVDMGRVECAYETAPRIGPDEWTSRTRTFERARRPSPSQPQADGWVVVEPAAR